MGAQKWQNLRHGTAAPRAPRQCISITQNYKKEDES